MAYQKVDIEKIYERKLYKSISIPSSIHSFSVCIEYMRDWFLSKFPKNYFKTVYIDSKHVVDDFREMNKAQMLKRLKPMVAIVPQLDFSFDRDKIDSYPFGLEVYTARGKFEDAFFKDKKHDVYLGMGLECNQINFTFRMRFSTRAQQMDMFKYIKMACRVGYTQGQDKNIDFHVPYGLMLQLASDLGYTIKNDRIKNVLDFLHYINSNSDMKFLYKLRYINGKEEFFIRVPNLYIHISVPDMSADDGEREGQLQNNYGIDMSATVRFPAPQLFSYYSQNKHTMFTLKEDVEDTVNVYSIKLGEAEDYNDKGWPQYLTTEYAEEDKDNPLEIDFNDLFKDSDIGRVIKYNNSISISSAIFLDIKVYNDGELIDADMDWSSMKLTSKRNMKEIMSFISIYADLEYLTNTIATLDNMNKNRLN